MAAEFHGVLPMMAHAVQTVRSGDPGRIAAAWILYILKPELHGKLRQKADTVTILERNTASTASTTGFFAGARGNSAPACGARRRDRDRRLM